MSDANALELDSGIAVIHANRLEALRDVLEYWLTEYPLAPLENEILLVQSNGMGQWLKQSLAGNASLGIAAAMRVQLPSLFVWSVYRAVLGQQIPLQQPLAKAPLSWRLYRLLPQLCRTENFASLANFLQDDPDGRKRFQLAEQIADLFDQYQVYRSDWIADWSQGRNLLSNSRGEADDLPAAQAWQAELWRGVLADLGPERHPFASRASVHAQFMATIDDLAQRPAGLPRRIVLFGLSSLPQQALEVLAKLGKFCQILLFVHNPCRHYWADVIEDRELFKAQRRRQRLKAGMPAELSPEQMHLHANPLLAAWGKQGRDYIRLLDQFDDTRTYAGWYWPENKIDVFADYGQDGRRNLLQRLQQTILDLEPAPAEPAPLASIDDSIAFHQAHSPQREVEILHDQLLARFEAAAGSGNPLLPRDVIVMVPDINRYAPHIRAVFGHIQADDPRYIPFSLADQQQRGENPLLLALEALLQLPESRFGVGEFLGLLEAPAFRRRFAVTDDALPKIKQWLEQAGIRWGLSAEQRAKTAGMPAALDANTWQFGLQRMLLGYAVGDGQAFNGIEPYAEIGGLEAQWLGNLQQTVGTLARLADDLAQERSAAAWQQTLLGLLDDCFQAESERDRNTLDNLQRCLSDWRDAAELGGLTDDDPLPLAIVREAWLAAVDQPDLQQRFLSGRVNFCTLMPMRAIPFRLVCLLGMNDGDYPRSHYPHAFDLMSGRGQYRPGDRSRRQDDQYLFLEALLSAREQLYVSWVGRSIRDNSECPPSVLVGQLRDFLQQSWRVEGSESLADALTVCHPLQPFGQAYVAPDKDPRLFSYAGEWFAGPSHDAPLPSDEAAEEAEVKTYQLTLEALAGFIKAPVRSFCQQTLKFNLEYRHEVGDDNEPFGFDRLEAHLYSQSMLDDLQRQQPADIEAYLQQQRAKLGRQGKLPLAGFAETAFRQVAGPAWQSWNRWQTLLADWPIRSEPFGLTFVFKLPDGGKLELACTLNRLYRNADGRRSALLHCGSHGLVKKTGLQYPHAVLPWLQHLAACADGMAPKTFIAGSDALLSLEPQAPEDALQTLQSLAHAWLQGIQAPLPAACRSGFAWLEAGEDKAWPAAQSRYDGDDWNDGEVAYDPYLARFYPSFAELLADGGEAAYQHWVERLYRPLFLALQQERP